MDKQIIGSVFKVITTSSGNINKMGHQLLINVIVLFVLMATYLQCSLGQLLVLSNCICPGHTMRLECTVVGGGFTIWRGTAFDCPSRDNEIFLRHSQFESGTALGLCNDGRIIARGARKISDSDGIKYSSQLIIHLDVNATIDGESVKCLHNNNTQEILIGTHTIAYTRDPPPPPEDVRLSDADRNRLDFTWDPVRRACPLVEYKVTAVNCGVCPTATYNISITCVVDDLITVIDNLCILSIQSVVCGITGENRSSVTATLRTPATPKFIRVLPHYSSLIRKLTKIDIQILVDSMDMFNISEGVDGSTLSYTFVLGPTGSDFELITIFAIIPSSSCNGGVCNFVFENLDSGLLSFPQLMVTVFASNVLGDSLPSNPSFVETMNSFLQVTFDPSRSRFSCQFSESVGNGSKSCNIVYGPKDPLTDESNGCFSSLNSVKSKAENTTDNLITTNTVTVSIPSLAQSGSEFCFVAIGTVTTLSVAVEGTFMIEPDSMDSTNKTNFTLVGSLSLAAVLVFVFTIFIIVVVLLARSRARALRQVELLRESTHCECQRENVTYEEINLPPVDIDTSKNVAYGHVTSRH